MGEFLSEFSGWLWGNLLYLLLGGGALFLFFPVHALPLPRAWPASSFGEGKEEDAPGEVSHFHAFAALSGTVGMGNEAGVAVAITQGGPGALFPMWVCPCSGWRPSSTPVRSPMYRGKDSDGWQGGPMYFIREGLGEKWKPLAIFFAACGLFVFRSSSPTNSPKLNRSMFFEPQGWFVGDVENTGNGLFGLLLAVLVGLVVVGESGLSEPSLPSLFRYGPPLRRYGSRYPPPSCRCRLARLFLVFSDAFTGEAVAGVLGTVIVTGVRRAAFSNEAGMGTEAMAHGAAKTKEPIREGLVAMWGPSSTPSSCAP